MGYAHSLNQSLFDSQLMSLNEIFKLRKCTLTKGCFKLKPTLYMLLCDPQYPCMQLIIMQLIVRFHLFSTHYHVRNICQSLCLLLFDTASMKWLVYRYQNIAMQLSTTYTLERWLLFLLWHCTGYSLIIFKIFELQYYYLHIL